MCSATGSGYVITCTARRWVVSGRLYCFQRPPAEGRREACKPSTDPTSRITNVRINRTAAHRSIFRPAFVKSARRTESTPSPLCHRQDEKSCRRSGVYLFAAPPRLVLAKNPVNFPAQAAASRHRQDEKSCRRSGVYLFSLHRRASSWRKSQSIFRLNRRRLVIGRTKNPAEGVACIFFAAPPRLVLAKNPVNFPAQAAASRHRQGEKLLIPRRTGSAP